MSLQDKLQKGILKSLSSGNRIKFNNCNKMMKDAINVALSEDPRICKLSRIINPQQAISLANMGKDIVFRIDGELYKVTKDTKMQYFVLYETFWKA